MAALMFPKPEPKPKKALARVTTSERDYVLNRDGGCVMARFDLTHECRTRFGLAHEPSTLDLLTVEHVKDALRMGRRAPSDRRHMVALCGLANDRVPSKEARAILRLYLAEVEPMSKKTTNEGALKTVEVAELLGVGVGTLKRLPPAELAYFTFGARGDRRYRREDVQAYIERKMVR
jgi:hypothetical protein